MNKQELKKKSKEDLLKSLDQLKGELATLRVEKVKGGAASKISNIKKVRKSIAVVNTLIRLGERTALKEAFKDKKYKPLDLRPKKTRAQRRLLKSEEKAVKSRRQQNSHKHFRARVYALKA